MYETFTSHGFYNGDIFPTFFLSGSIHDIPALSPSAFSPQSLHGFRRLPPMAFAEKTESSPHHFYLSLLAFDYAADPTEK